MKWYVLRGGRLAIIRRILLKSQRSIEENLFCSHFSMGKTLI